jgi:hypothetical protein
MAQRIPFSLVLRKVATTTTPSLSSEPVPRGEIWCFQRVVIENETSAATEVQLQVVTPDDTIIVAAQASPGANTVYWYDNEIYCPERTYIKVAYTGAVSGDTIRTYCTGYRVRDVAQPEK